MNAFFYPATQSKTQNHVHVRLYSQCNFSPWCTGRRCKFHSKTIFRRGFDGCSDLNDDASIDLTDLIIGLKLLAGVEVIEIRNGFCAGNSTIDMGEALYILQEVAQ